MSKTLKLIFNCEAPMVDAFVIKPSQLDNLTKLENVEGYDWICKLEDFHADSSEHLCIGIDLNGCEIQAELDGNPLEISGISTTESEKDLTNEDYLTELEYRNTKETVEEFIQSEIIICASEPKISGSELAIEDGDYVVMAFTPTKFTSYEALIEVDDVFLLHDINLNIGDFDSPNDAANLFYGNPNTRYSLNSKTLFIERPIHSVTYKGKTVDIERDFTSYSPTFECYKFENGEFVSADELSEFFNG